MFVRRIAGRSMQPTLQPGQIVLCASRENIIAKDIVIATLGGRMVVKRVEKIERNSYFIVGDNRQESHDSREYGPVQKNVIIGVVIMKFPHIKPTEAPNIVQKRFWFVPYATAATLMILALPQLVGFDKFAPTIYGYGLPGGLLVAQILAAILVFSEIFALPFLLRMNLSPLARAASALLGPVVALTWLSLLDWSLLSHHQLTQSGFLGTMFVHISTSVAQLLMTAIALLIIWSFFLLQGRVALSLKSSQLKR